MAEGPVYLNLQDVEITDASVIREETGKRSILVKLNNGSDANLYGSGRSVRLCFYSDATCESLISSLTPINITSPDDLKMIAEGGYSQSVIFDIGEHLASMPVENKLTEILLRHSCPQQ